MSLPNVAVFNLLNYVSGFLTEVCVHVHVCVCVLHRLLNCDAVRSPLVVKTALLLPNPDSLKKLIVNTSVNNTKN